MPPLLRWLSSELELVLELELALESFENLHPMPGLSIRMRNQPPYDEYNMQIGIRSLSIAKSVYRLVLVNIREMVRRSGGTRIIELNFDNLYLWAIVRSRIAIPKVLHTSSESLADTYLAKIDSTGQSACEELFMDIWTGLISTEFYRILQNRKKLMRHPVCSGRCHCSICTNTNTRYTSHQYRT